MTISLRNVEEFKSAAAGGNYNKSLVIFVLHSSRSFFAVEACKELLDLANELSQREFFEHKCIEDFDEVSALAKQRAKTTVILFGNVNEAWKVDDRLKKSLRCRLPCLPRIGLVGGAALIAAEVPFLKSHSICAHPNLADAARELEIRISSDCGPVCQDGSVHSAIGGLAALHMTKAMIAEDLGQFVADAVAEYVGLSVSRTQARTSLETRYRKMAGGQTLVDKSVTIMLQNIENPLTSGEISKLLQVSTRQLERRYRQSIGEPPMVVYRNIRLERAFNLLRYSDLSVLEISLAAGFGSQSVFRTRFFERYKMTPLQSRTKHYSA